MSGDRGTGDQAFFVGNQVSDPHAGHVRHPLRLADAAAQGDSIDKLRHHAVDVKDIPLYKGTFEALRVQRKFFHRAGLRLSGRDALQIRFTGVGYHRQATCQLQQLIQGFRCVFDFINRRLADLTRQCHIAQGGWNDDHVTIQQLGVGQFVALAQKVVQIKFGHQLARAFELNAAHGAFGRRAPAGKEAADQGGEAAEVVGARTACLTHHINGDGAQLAKRDIELKVFEVFANGRTDDALRIGGLDARQSHRPHPGNVDEAVAVDDGAHLNVHRTPAPYQHFIARAQGIVARDGWVDQRGEGVGGRARVARWGGVGKKVHTKQRQGQPRRLKHKLLKLIGAQGLELGLSRL